MSERIELRKELIKSLDNLKQAFLDLDFIWSEIKGSGDEVLLDYMENSMSKDYPFPISFDDATGYVGYWVNNRLEELENPMFFCLNNVNAIMQNFEKLSIDNKNIVLSKLKASMKGRN